MSEKTIPFVVTDRRKFTPDGQPRPDADPSPEREARPETITAATSISGTVSGPVSAPGSARQDASLTPSQPSLTNDPSLPPAPTPQQMEQSRLAFQTTADRLDVAIRSANPGADHPPAMNFEQVVQSVYMQAILQLGGGTEEGQQPQVDILGARQSVDMLGILYEKTSGNLSSTEQALIESALFELRLAFLEITQALARSAQGRQPAPGAPGGRPGPSIVR